MKRLLGYKKKIVSLMCAVMIISICVLSTSFDSEAVGFSSSNTFSVSYPEPDTSDGSGYLCIFYQNSSGYFLNTFLWTITPYETTAAINNFMDIDITSKVVTFTPNSNGLFNWQLAEFTSSDNLYIHKHGVFKSSDNDYLQLSYGSSNIIGFIYNGNVGSVYTNLSTNQSFEVHFSDSVDADRLYNYMNIIWAHLENMDGDTSDIIEELQAIFNQNVSINQKLDDLKSLYNRLISEQEKTNTWLGKIWESIQEFINPNSNDSQKTDEYNAESNTQKSEIDDLNEQNQVDKVDVDSATAQVDSNIDYDNMAQYGGVLATITNNSYVLQMILIVVSIGIIAYVLFGKR